CRRLGGPVPPAVDPLLADRPAREPGDRRQLGPVTRADRRGRPFRRFTRVPMPFRSTGAVPRDACPRAGTRLRSRFGPAADAVASANAVPVACPFGPPCATAVQR